MVERFSTLIPIMKNYNLSNRLYWSYEIIPFNLDSPKSVLNNQQ